MTRSNRHPNRLTRYVFRLGAAACGVIVAATVASMWRRVYVSVAGWRIVLDFGSVYVFSNRVAPWFAWSIGSASQDFHLWTAKWGIGGVTVRSYPTWMALLLAWMPVFFAWRRLRRPVPGHCRKCGYDLTGNVSGVCSECGTETEGGP